MNNVNSRIPGSLVHEATCPCLFYGCPMGCGSCICGLPASPVAEGESQMICDRCNDKQDNHILINGRLFCANRLDLFKVGSMETGKAADKNIHGEILPEKYRFTEEDEKRLDALDFYTHPGAIKLPPANVTEADRFMAWRWYGQFMVPCTEEHIGATAWRIARERQFRATLSVTEGVDGWIEIKEGCEMPPLGEDVLFNVREEGVEMGFRVAKKWKSSRNDGYGDEIYFEGEQVTHWQRITAPSSLDATKGDRE